MKGKLPWALGKADSVAVACDRCRRYKKMEGARFCSGCVAKVRRAMFKSGYIADREYSVGEERRFFGG